MKGPILDTPVEEHLRPATSEAEVGRMWRSFKLREQTPARPDRRWKPLAAAAAALAIAAMAGIGLVGSRPGSLTLAGGHPVPSALGAELSPAAYELDDGSQIVLAPRTVARVMANDAAQLRAQLTHGSARFDITPGGPRRWVIEAGPLRVEVLGTRFTVTHGPEATEVHVERGRVAVYQPGDPAPTVLEAGGSVRVERAEEQAAVRADSTPVSAESNAPPRSPELTSEPERGAEPRPDWRQLARRGEFDRALRVLGEAGLARRVRTAGAEDLLLLADITRRAGRLADTRRIYSQLIDRHPENARAAVAAFSLGRMQLDAEPAEAADSFAFARQHPAGAALAEDATALEVRAAQQAGASSRAARVAAEYLERFPSGRRAGAMRRVVDGR